MQEKVIDMSYVWVMTHLRNINAGPEFQNDHFFSTEILENMALDYLHSAILLLYGVDNDRDGNTVTRYLIPCAYLCIHSIELKLKHCLVEKGDNIENGHDINILWEILDEKELPHYEEISGFLKEVSIIDENGTALRYGVSRNLTPLKESFMFDIEALVSNTMFLFNIVDKYIVQKYRYKQK